MAGKILNIKSMIEISLMPMYYNVQFQKPIHEIEKGTVKEVMIIRMIGRIYKPGRGDDGKFLDFVGEKDNRIMVMGAFDYTLKIMDEFYWVATNDDELNTCLVEVPRQPVEAFENG